MIRSHKSRILPYRLFLCCGLVIMLVPLRNAVAAADQEPWILVDTLTKTLTVLTGSEQRPGRILAKFRKVALGRGGVTQDRVSGDGKTPLGTYHVAWIKWDSRFDIFFGLDFPTVDHADRAYQHQLIDRETYGIILDALLDHRLPPQDTPLGGGIGIHGLGRGDPLIHRHSNWTDGCVALTNRQIAGLARWVRIGTKVVIR
jgi:murein L,D-transpeptidase YafK